MPKLFYFLAPSFDINPDSPTAPRLGSIYRDIDSELTSGSLNHDNRLPVDDARCNRSSTAHFADRKERGIKGWTGLTANAPAIPGLGGSLTYAFASGKSTSFRCSLLETTEFSPTAEYVEQSLKASTRVRDYLENAPMGWRRVYMITGLKVATDFGVERSSHWAHGPSLTITADGAGIGVAAVEAGTELGLDVQRTRTTTFGRTLNKIVFAYRAVRIRERRRGGGANFKLRSGGKYGMGAGDDEDSDSSDEEEKDGDEGGQWEVEPLDEDCRAEEFPETVLVDVRVE